MIHKKGDWVYIVDALISKHLIGAVRQVLFADSMTVVIEGSKGFDQGTSFLRSATDAEILAAGGTPEKWIPKEGDWVTFKANDNNISQVTKQEAKDLCWTSLYRPSTQEEIRKVKGEREHERISGASCMGRMSCAAPNPSNPSKPGFPEILPTWADGDVNQFLKDALAYGWNGAPGRAGALAILNHLQTEYGTTSLRKAKDIQMARKAKQAVDADMNKLLVAACCHSENVLTPLGEQTRGLIRGR